MCVFGFRRGPFVGPRGHALEHVERLLIAGQPVHIEHAGHDLVNGVEGRPDALALLQAVPPGRREGAEIFAAELLLALGQLRDHVVALRLGLLVAVGRQLRAGREKVADEMAAQFAGTLAVFRLLPSAQRFGRSDRQAGIGAEVYRAAGRLPAAPCSRDSIPARRGRRCRAADEPAPSERVPLWAGRLSV